MVDPDFRYIGVGNVTLDATIYIIYAIAMNIDRLAAMLLRLIVHLLKCLFGYRVLGLSVKIEGC